MKRVYPFLLMASLLLIGGGMNAQSEDISIGLVMPTEVKKLNEGHLLKIENKLLSVLSQNGISAQGLCNGIVMYPGIDVYDESQVNTGMQNLSVTQVTLSLFVRQLDSREVFVSTNIELRGSGRTKEQALNTAINSIKPGDEKWTVFLNQARKKIGQYYDKMCNKILSQAGQLSNTGQIEQALGLAFSIPKEVTCFDEANKLSVKLYQRYINENCAKQLQMAKSFFAANNYADGLKVIGRIDPTASCFKEAVAEMKKVEPAVDDETRRNWALLQKIYDNSFELEKHRLTVIRDISVAYWDSHRPNYDYTVIVKN